MDMDEFVETAKTIKEKTGKYGICSGVADDTNIFNYWVRSHGELLFSDDNKSLGYDDDQILVDYLDMWKDLMDCDAERIRMSIHRFSLWDRRQVRW